MKPHITTHGDLELTVQSEERAELKDAFENKEDFGSDNFMYDFFERLTCNSEYEWIRPEEIGALTDCPILGIRGNERPAREGESNYTFIAYHDHGQTFVQDVEKYWWYPYAESKSPLDDLLQYGYVIFQRA